jgi:hypothetical protein
MENLRCQYWNFEMILSSVFLHRVPNTSRVIFDVSRVRVHPFACDSFEILLNAGGNLPQFVCCGTDCAFVVRLCLFH